MATYLLLHGAGSDAWYWHRVVPLLEARGHDVVAPDLPCDDDSAGFEEYADVAVAAAGHRSHLVVVAQSLAGFTAPIVCVQLPVDLLVLLAAMVPAPGERAGDWWAATRWEDDHGPMAEPFDPVTEFFHDVPDDITAQAMAATPRRQSDRPFEEPWPLASWPDVPTRFLLCRDDRFFPAAFQRRVVQERLGLVPDEIDGGHLVALSRPEELVDRLEALRVS